MRRILTAAKVITDDGSVADAISIENDHIESIGMFADLSSATPEYERIDFPGLCLSPGFIDTHCHMTGNGQINSPMELQTASHELLLLRAAANASAAVREGITTLRDLGAPNKVILPFRDIANSGLIPSPKILAAGGTLTRTGGHGHWWGLEADTNDQIRTAVRSQAKAGTDALKVMVDGGIDLGRNIPGLLYFTGEELGIAVHEAHNLGLRVAAHCLTSNGVRSAVQAGVDSIEHAIFYELDLDDTRYDRHLGEEILERGIFVDPGPAFAYSVFKSAEGEKSIFAKNARLFKRRLQDDGLMHQQGIPLVAGSDGGWFATPFGDFALIPKLYVDESGLSASDAFDTCTKNGAASLGIADKTGSIAAGKQADIVALDGDPTDDITAMARVKMTMVAGRILFDGTNVVTPSLDVTSLAGAGSSSYVC